MFTQVLTNWIESLAIKQSQNLVFALSNTLYSTQANYQAIFYDPGWVILYKLTINYFSEEIKLSSICYLIGTCKCVTESKRFVDSFSTLGYRCDFLDYINIKWKVR